MVEFQPERGAPSYAFTEADGSYSLQYQTDRKGALLGHHTIRLRTPKEITDPETGDTVSVKESIPRKYNDESTLEFEVAVGANYVQRRNRGNSRTSKATSLVQLQRFCDPFFRSVLLPIQPYLCPANQECRKFIYQGQTRSNWKRCPFSATFFVAQFHKITQILFLYRRVYFLSCFATRRQLAVNRNSTQKGKN